MAAVCFVWFVFAAFKRDGNKAAKQLGILLTCLGVVWLFRDSIWCSPLLLSLSWLSLPGVATHGCYFNLTPAEVVACSPEIHIGPRVPTLLTVGDSELPELRRQTADYASRLRTSGESVEEISAPGCNHFTITEKVALPDGAALNAVVRAFS
jgi:hypothetical protein